jgi:regulatory protein YycI of two-component signal transduction system YycFG
MAVILIIFIVIVIVIASLYGNKKLKGKSAKVNEKDIREKFTLPEFDE